VGARCEQDGFGVANDEKDKSGRIHSAGSPGSFEGYMANSKGDRHFDGHGIRDGVFGGYLFLFGGPDFVFWCAFNLWVWELRE